MNESESSDSEGSPMAFMFDTAKKKDVESFEFYEESLGTFRVGLKMIKGDPGHQQSGQYLWPASEANARYVLANQVDLGLKGRQLAVVELGAGCGLSGLAVSHLPNVDSVVLTDYDYGALQLLEDNAAACVKTYTSRANAAVGDFIVVEKLKWGAELSPTFASKIKKNSQKLLLLGSDLIYCYTVCMPLFTSVKALLSLASEGSCFVLVSSFELKSEIESVAIQAYTSLGLVVKEVVRLNVDERTCRVQTFCLPRE
jgi:predicted nicotinamide N-methyase